MEWCAVEKRLLTALCVYVVFLDVPGAMELLVNCEEASRLKLSANAQAGSNEGIMVSLTRCSE